VGARRGGFWEYFCRDWDNKARQFMTQSGHPNC
jgi:hypothetical protein